MNQTPDFDGLAGVYRWMEYFSFGPWLALTRRTFLKDATACRRALVIGDGDGRFTARLLRQNPDIRVDAVDASAAMLESLLRHARGGADRVTVHQADARSWTPPQEDSPYDLVATHFFLDCLTQAEIETLAKRLRKYVTPDAIWIVSEFAIPANGFARILAKPLISFLYLCFGVLTGLQVRKLPNHRRSLDTAGFSRSRVRRRLAGILVAEVWSVTFGKRSEGRT
ncbi:MAG: class I SAM-dependent methyltransferase [Terracidiphilus sp.]|jgi:SAM-dependent methyltransferase